MRVVHVLHEVIHFHKRNKKIGKKVIKLIHWHEVEKKGNDDKNNICLAKKEKLERKVRN